MAGTYETFRLNKLPHAKYISLDGELKVQAGCQSERFWDFLSSTKISPKAFHDNDLQELRSEFRCDLLVLVLGLYKRT